MTKKKLIICAILATCIFFISICFIKIYIDNFHYNTSESKEDFLNDQYKSFNGGEDASEFFDRFVNTKDALNVSFKYSDASKVLPIVKCYTVFSVDVTYDQEKYEEIISNNSEYVISNLENTRVGDYSITLVAVDEQLYQNNYCGIFYNDKDNIVRYLFVCDYNVDSSRYIMIADHIKWSIDLNWNAENQ